VAGPLIANLGPRARHLRQVQPRLGVSAVPTPDGPEIDAIDAPGDGIVILIEVPPKPEEVKPFLVHEAIVGHRLEGAFISIVRRRGEASIPITAPMLREVEKMVPTVETGQRGSRDDIRRARETTADPQS
jgi:hypothetical protein